PAKSGVGVDTFRRARGVVEKGANQMTHIQAAEVPVNSTLLASMSYEADAALLHLEFRDGSLYRYFGVPADIYAGLFAANSKGVYFNRRIRGSFPYALL